MNFSDSAGPIGAVLLLLLVLAAWAFLLWIGYYVLYRVIRAAVRDGIDASQTGKSVLDMLELAYLSGDDDPVTP